MQLIEYMKQSSNLVPFKTINGYILAISNGSMNLIIPIKNLAGNGLHFCQWEFSCPILLKG